jgi:hypothetical protein
MINRTSATNCARIYNSGLTKMSISSALPSNWSTSFELDVEDVWNGFFLHALLLDQKERQDIDEDTVLELDHNAPSQSDRLSPALQARNARMVGPGQEAWNHACELCCWVRQDEDGELCMSFYSCPHPY